MQKSETVGDRKRKLPGITCVYWGGEDSQGSNESCGGGGWRAVEKTVPQDAMSHGNRGNGRVQQTHEFDLALSCCLPLPLPLSRALAALGLQYQAEAGQVSATSVTPGCHSHWPQSLHSCPQGTLSQFLFQSSAFFHLKRPLFFSNSTSSPKFCLLTLNSFSPFSFFSFIFYILGFLGEGIAFISSWFSSCSLTSLLILASFHLSLTCLCPLILLLPYISPQHSFCLYASSISPAQTY